MKALTYTIKHDIKGLACSIDSVLSAIQSEHVMNDQIKFEIKVVLNELIVNAICHGNNFDQDKDTCVTIKLMKDDYLYISVKDQGCGCNGKMDLNSLDNYVREKNDMLCEHGRGLFIVEQLCDRVKFNRCGNKISIIKYLH